MGDEEKKSRTTRLREKARESLVKTFRAYQEWQLAASRESGELDPGDQDTFVDWIKDEYGTKS